MTLEQLLDDRQGEILAKFVCEVERKDLPPPGVPKSVLVDHIPLFLGEISAELARASGARPSLEAVEVAATARQHGKQRWKIGYDLQAVVREYGALRHAVLETARAAGVSLNSDESEVLARYLNLGVSGAAAEYVRWSEERLLARQRDLEFLSEAGELLASSLDYKSTLTRLTRLLVPRLADFCIVRLDGCSVEETPVAHVDPAKVEFIRDVLRQFPEPDGAHANAEVVRTGKPVLVEDMPEGLLESIARSPEHLAQLRQLGACSFLAVPLRIKTGLLGTITLAWSDSGRRYGPSDLLLTEDLARRAAAAIDNARLYELSREERARAEAATRTKDEFVAIVSHELRTPLNVIMGWVRLLRSGTLAPETVTQALEVVERNANAQSQLVADLLDISRVITGKIRLDPAQVELANLLTLVLEDARIALDAKRLELSVDLTPESTLLRGDGERLKQIIWNLLFNAIKFTPKGGRIWISLRRVESDLELVVKDNGVGMSPEFLPHVFDSFRQSDSKTTRAHNGLGIGLSITKHLVDLHGGSIEARSDGPGTGAQFLVRLPVSPVISTTVGVAKIPATSPQRQELARPELAGMSILVVDDEEDARDLLRIVLESCGVMVQDARSVQEALARLEAQRVDLLISDIGMPGEDGYSLIRALRALPRKDLAGIPAIALTAFARNEDRTRALLEGFNVHMAKPVEPAELLLAVADLSGHARQR